MKRNFAHNENEALDLYKEFEIRKKYNLGVKWLTAAQVQKQYKLNCFGAILSNTAASIDAYKLAHELIAFNAQRGMEVYDQTEIEKFNLNQDEPVIEIKDGYIIADYKNDHYQITFHFFNKKLKKTKPKT